MSMSVALTTEKGKKTLGLLLKYFREQQGWSLDELAEQIEVKTGYKLSKSTISQLERGNNEPKWNTLAILAATGYLVNPSSGQPLKTAELFEIACESLSFKICIHPS
ncbi:MAG: helix-turn-helix domain-containing protein [Halothece sp.]